MQMEDTVEEVIFIHNIYIIKCYCISSFPAAIYSSSVVPREGQDISYI
jgi:hypothetical protein